MDLIGAKVIDEDTQSTISGARVLSPTRLAYEPSEWLIHQPGIRAGLCCLGLKAAKIPAAPQTRLPAS